MTFMRYKKKGFEFGDMSIRFTHPVRVEQENKSGSED
jgi:hypothetical protein